MDGVLLFDFFISQKFSYITGFFPTPEIATMASVSMVKKGRGRIFGGGSGLKDPFKWRFFIPYHFVLFALLVRPFPAHSHSVFALSSLVLNIYHPFLPNLEPQRPADNCVLFRCLLNPLLRTLSRPMSCIDLHPEQ